MTRRRPKTTDISHTAKPCSVRRRKLNVWLEDVTAISLPNVFNPWQQVNDLDVDPDGAALRVKRLKLHLNSPDPRILMIGEASGHLGAKYSGIPFTSERLLFEGQIPRLEKYQHTRISTRKLPFSEPSATSIWKIAHELGIEHQIVLWNAFPWHPYKDTSDSNRTPTTTEMKLGLEILNTLVGLYPNATLVAIGRKSQASLEGLNLQHIGIRHPSMGGAPAFRAGMTKLIAGLA